ncbi:MAG: hypothetical protein PUB24_07410 [Lachnospiraceae bacterium]|nr:hypothetical protein [Lachnospiraceae bacterium]MDY4792787.1 DUF6715 family protein [Pararoseburia sp.]
MKKAIRIGLSVIICAGLVVGYYYYLSHRNDNNTTEDATKVTEVDKILQKDFDEQYPTSPREVVKWYNRIITAYYGEEYTDEQLEGMADQARKLLDDELLQYNPKDTYLENLKKDIDNYKTLNKKIVQSSVSDSNDITYATVKGASCAYVNAYYFSKEGSNYSRTYQEFVLRKDSKGKWKILTFRLTEGEDNE